MQQDPFAARSVIAGVRAEARASLLNPSRPYTPAAGDNRHLLDDNPYGMFPRAAFDDRHNARQSAPMQMPPAPRIIKTYGP